MVGDGRELQPFDDQITNRAPWLTLAFQHLGMREKAGRDTEVTITEFFRDIGHPTIADDETPWCAAFVGACLHRAGFESTRSLAARSYLNLGTSIQADEVGAIAVFKRTRNPALGHVGFIIGSTAQSLFILGGNQSDGVTVEAFPRADLLGRRWPKAKIASGTASAPAPPARANDVFATAFAHVLKMEGGFSDDPFDPGGPTNRGITIATYARHLGLPPSSITDPQSRDDLLARLRVLTPADVKPIYHRYYWLPSSSPDLPAALSLFHFDTSVNHGVRRAAELLQMALGVDVDGDIGPQTLTAAQTRNQATTLARYADVRRARYRALPHFWRFGRGWLNRVDSTLASASALLPSSSSRKPSSMRETDADPSILPTTTAQSPSTGADQQKWWGHSMTIWGALLTGLSTVLPVLGPLIGVELSPELIQKLGAELTRALQALGGVLGIILTIVGRARANTPLMRREMQIRL